ncbi:hypothetical protein O6P43_022635 [Quillaja saponaria]|uniref:Uncharacterized protein n=1 Tax=Quillaja saponaria TaxID=32244 RepID=A0AAD7PIM9_QUISA|nr:hypothetical protein O6P43_022635 [Quillaja saponaria]
MCVRERERERDHSESFEGILSELKFKYAVLLKLEENVHEVLLMVAGCDYDRLSSLSCAVRYRPYQRKHLILQN